MQAKQVSGVDVSHTYSEQIQILYAALSLQEMGLALWFLLLSRNTLERQRDGSGLWHLLTNIKDVSLEDCHYL